MPLYSWQCECGATTEVKRAMVDIDNPPEACETCNTQSFKQRIIAPRLSNGVKGFILVDAGVGWPSHGFYNRVPERK